MEKFVFEIEDGARPPNTHEVELEGLKGARTEAVRLLGAMIKHEPEIALDSKDWRLRVRDRHGVVKFELRACTAGSNDTKVG